MVYSLTYRRPSYVPSSSSASLSGDEKQKSIDESIHSTSSTMSNGIPPELALERIVDGGTCPPVTLRDFLNYCKYVEHSAELLQFYLWFRDYVKRFDRLSPNEKALAPIWDSRSASKEIRPKSMAVSADAATVFQGTTFGNGRMGEEVESADPFNTPPHTPSREVKRAESSFDSDILSLTSIEKVDHSAVAASVFKKAGLMVPMTVQPYRDEINRIIAIYFADMGARQLNVSSKDHSNLMRALEKTTHPSAFKDIATALEWDLRNQAHANFVRWSIENGNDARKTFARWLGIVSIFGALVAYILLTVSHASRAYRVIPFVLLFVGVATLAAAVHGMCVVLHGLHHRHLRPWELFYNDAEAGAEMKDRNDSSDTVDSQTSSNSYEDEPWVAKYQKRNLVRKIFDREVWIKEPALRQIQDTIFLQAILLGAVCSIVTTAIFCAIPKGNLI
ncbi:hypothetical protein EJ04DRAFT_547931 [Polyplosphaeria fusca]|uniref:RGS domain-containing protein n=1 Tax=Polyplosphaeria fusca TaxID=682080 RepID=A0A9P4R8F8_9PLEO|nr:hypothetical protein EJ04DRAFT_547931 [Polyplosphaeria fusca]